MLPTPDPNEPLVSVVIPTYNQASYLPASVDSILSQDYGHVEVIVVDDGSTDATPQILDRYADSIVHMRQPNRGAANALNEGIRAARGKYICWLSSDDMFMPGKLRRQVAAFLEDPQLAICYTGFTTMDAEGRDLRDRSDIPPRHADAFVAVFWANHINGSTVMMPRSIFDEVGPFDETLRADVDGDMWLRVLAKHHALHIPGSYLRYRVHGAALSANTALMRASKSKVRLARVRDGSLVRRLRAADPATASAVLAEMSVDFSRWQLTDVARALLGASIANGAAPRPQMAAARAVIAAATPVRVRRLGGSARRVSREATRQLRRVGRRLRRRA